eukprot:gnl/MRDRNA2_/MRDRNA2_88520_c0_seq1.p1 gnl/MRDRNA2_/MRDRNA2_88520_c0~~gnl/MRDRNA2_/MRDRNA2_88520_c0_seq1.p1  ORF type:complete len:196 (-),score=58.94 gnl/MRDRNA2_/MRDRNA2_88520_c0_seq1:107-694(-)
MPIQTMMTQQTPKSEENLTDIKDSGRNMAHFASLLLLTKSFMGEQSTNVGGQSTRKKQVLSIQQEEISDEEECLSAEESTVAGTSCIDADDCALSRSSFSDTEELIENEQNDHMEQHSQVLASVDETTTDGFFLVGRRLAKVFADLDEESSEEGDDLSLLSNSNEEIDVANWYDIGKRLSSSSVWMVDSDVDEAN